MRVVLKRARHFITCNGKFYGEEKEERIKALLSAAETADGAQQLSLFSDDSLIRSLPKSTLSAAGLSLSGDTANSSADLAGISRFRGSATTSSKTKHRKNQPFHPRNPPLRTHGRNLKPIFAAAKFRRSLRKKRQKAIDIYAHSLSPRK